MNITLSLRLLRWTIGAFDIRVELDDAEAPLVPVPQKLVDTISDFFASRYVKRRLT